MESKTAALPDEACAAASEAAASPASGRTASAEPFPTRSPAEGEPLDDVAGTEPSAVAMIVERARAAQVTWAEIPIRERAELIARVKKRLLARAEEIAALLHRECGKPIEEAALAEVLPNADLVDYWTLSIEELLDESPVDLDALAYPGKVGRIRRDPRGVVALITPWNYPVAIPLRTIVPALLAGNAVVFKPSEVTPRAGALVASLFDGLLPEGVLGLAQGGSDVGAALIEAGVDLVVFTGSVATGKKVAVACAERLVPTSLELGGKDSAIVLDDCDLERAARGVVWGAFTNAGQNCASIERVYVEQAIADRFIARVVALTGELRVGVDVGAMTTARQAEIVRHQLDAAVESGAEVLAGGAPEAGSLAFPPTVVKIEREDTPLLQDETFGPILPVMVVKNAEEAIARTNASRFALTTSLWTRGYERAHALARRLRSGVVTINNHGFTGALPAAPWTGTGDSGSGITSSPHALSGLTRPRFFLEDRSRAKSELWWYPYTPALRTVAFAMARARGGAGFFGRISALVELVAAFARRLLGR
ncbi:aldehyde dehydrogenase family protein [Sorangium sp. So ce887]|uniref:aldehyde dehydrogenase family protein n=1 Tax=Sorangium sp. So ce887 TaxID=3133324 RepID=UPI003F6012D0